MPISGTLSHIDISVGSPDRSIPFYQILLTGLGYKRYEPGPHHMAFHADSRKTVDNVSDSLLNAGFEVLDPPHDYSGQIGYSAGYYAAFFADPDGVKLEAVHLPAE